MENGATQKRGDEIGTNFESRQIINTRDVLTLSSVRIPVNVVERTVRY